MCKSDNKGAILIELMITVALSLLLLMTLMQLYLTTLHSVRLQMALHTIQHQATTAIAILRSSVHQAGYMGCAKLSENFPVDGELTVQNKLQSIEPNTLQIRHASLEHATLTDAMHNKRLLFTTRDHYFNPGDIAIVSDCMHAEIFKIKSTYRTRNGQKLIASHPLRYRYDKNSEVARFVIDRFYVKSSALYQEDINGIKTELVSGIEEMQFEFSVQQQNYSLQMQANEIDDWSKVIGVAVRLLVASPPFKKEWYAYFRV